MHAPLTAGDVFACYGNDACSRLISYATASLRGPAGLRLGPSHVALCAYTPEETLGWWESTSLCRRPCLIQGRRVRGVQVHEPRDRLGDYVSAGGRVDVYRLVEIDELGNWESVHLYRILRRWIKRGTNYDVIGAALSGLRISSALRLLPAANQDSLFCSELIAAVLMRLQRMNRVNPTTMNPSKLLRRLVWEGTYRKAMTFSGLDDIARVFDGGPATVPFCKEAG